MHTIIKLSLFFIAVINPISKIAVISVLPEKATLQDVERIALRSTLAAFLMLAAFCVAGNFILSEVFHVPLYAFQIVGGFVVFYYGFMALRNGAFFEFNPTQNIADLSIVPIASPLIAGPATITAVISMTAQYRAIPTLAGVSVALVFNLVIMVLSRFIAKPLVKFNLLGVLIRIMGLFVASIGMSMMLSGITLFMGTLKAA